MATERQIAANRRNARNSTGPRSAAGKKRVSRNAYRHGLSASPQSDPDFEEQLEKLVCKLAAAGVPMERARLAARAKFDLARASRVKAEVIASALARDDSFAEKFTGAKESTRSAKTAPMEGGESDRSGEALRCLLDLVKLDRYERRASAKLDRALREAMGRGLAKRW